MITGQATRAGAIRVAVLVQYRLVGEAIGDAIAAAGLTVEIVSTNWQQLLQHPAMPVDVAVTGLHLDDGVLGSTRVSDLSALGVSSVVVGAHSDTAAAAAALRAGALGFVATSDPLDELVTAIRSAAAGVPRAEAVPEPLDVDPGLGRQEQRALVLYADGRSIREVAHDMSTTEETVKSYIKRGRRKFRDIGVDVGTRVLLRDHAHREGWVRRA